MRRAPWLLLLAALLVVTPGWLSAQEESRTITGQVTAAESGQPMAGVQVMVRGTNTGALTDGRGNFSISVPASATTLAFTYVGYRTEERPIAGITEPIQVQLQVQAIGIEGIVVTALGVEREKRSLGYSIQDVSGEDLAAIPELNVVNSLKGNVAGVHITEAGPTGGSSRIVIRGASSIAGNNQPLFIIDGVPIDNSSNRNGGFGGIDYGNAAQDIDPNNIESISVLKGPNAAALYGSRAQNGAVVITTKSGAGIAGAGSLGLSATVSMMAETPLRLPTYQNLYGQGLNGQYRFVDGDGGGTYDHYDESWGPRLDGQPIDQFTGPQQPWVPAPNNIRDYFEVGRTLNSNIAVARAGDNSNVRLSVTNTNVNGMFPGSDINRVGVALKGGANLTDRLTADASVNYLNQSAENRAGTGYDEDNPMQSFIWFGRQVDMNALKNYKCTGNEPIACQVGAQYNWNYNYHNNPYWSALVNGNEDRRDRIIGHIATGYQISDWLGARAQFSRDWYRDYRKSWVHHYSLDDDGQGSFSEDNIYRAETNAELILNATRQLAPDLRMDLNAGGNIRRNDFQFSGVDVGRLTVPGIYTIANAAETPDPDDRRSVREVRSLFGSASFNYGGYLNVDVTGRNDWSSTLPAQNNSYFYPSVSSAFVFTDAFGLTSDILSSGKVRASWTRVGSDADPYQLSSVLLARQGWGGVPMFSVDNELANADLKPEETSAWEVGTDLGFLNERVGFVLTYYDSRTRNQILGVQVSRASGFTNQVLNAGEVRNYGTELLLTANPIRTSGGFNWDMTVNWSKNNSQVRELYSGLETLVLGTYWSLNVEARGPDRDENGNVVKYHPYGTLFGNGYLRCTGTESTPVPGCNAQTVGEILLNANGTPRRDANARVLGNYNPDWTGGIQNRFSYGPVDLTVSVDGQMGGDIFSTTDMWGNYAGVLESSLVGRENNVGAGIGPDGPDGEPIDCDPGIVVRGLLPDGTVNTPGASEARVCPQDYFGNLYYNIHEAHIYDASYVKLREVRLGYTLPASLVSRLGFSGGSIALIGRNLALWSKTENIDPETAFDASNAQGIEFGQHPTARSIGLSLSIRP